MQNILKGRREKKDGESVGTGYGTKHGVGLVAGGGGGRVEQGVSSFVLAYYKKAEA
jgi:hypothetical protein